MKCPYCAHEGSRVIDSRTTDNNSTIRRRRECESCQERFTTYEKYERVPLLVEKSDGSREMFSEEKILSGLYKATEKRPVTEEELSGLVKEIKAEMLNKMEQVVTSKQIGNLVMEKLKKIDEVAYVRFASVYREFKDVQNFKEELDKLLLENQEAGNVCENQER